MSKLENLLNEIGNDVLRKLTYKELQDFAKKLRKNDPSNPFADHCYDFEFCSECPHCECGFNPNHHIKKTI